MGEEKIRTELLTPAGDARLVVDSTIVERLVREQGYIVIEPTDLPQTHEAARFFPADAAAKADADAGDGDGVAKTSKDYTATEAIALIGEMDEDSLVDFLDEDEERSTVSRAAELRSEALDADDA